MLSLLAGSFCIAGLDGFNFRHDAQESGYQLRIEMQAALLLQIVECCLLYPCRLVGASGNQGVVDIANGGNAAFPRDFFVNGML